MHNESSFYPIYKPMAKNAHRGNVTFNINNLVKFDKDFIFDQVVDGTRYTRILSKEWVREHMMPVHIHRKNQMPICFYILKISEIIDSYK